MGGAIIWNTCMLGMFYFTSHHAVLAVINVFLIGTCFAIVPALQTRLMDVAAEAQTLAAALNHSAFNIANALGAWLGGLVIAGGFGWSATAWVGALLGLSGFIVFVISMLLENATSKVELAEQAA
jgi:DHA1 family inner membrane transport protein